MYFYDIMTIISDYLDLGLGGIGYSNMISSNININRLLLTKLILVGQLLN